MRREKLSHSIVFIIVLMFFGDSQASEKLKGSVVPAMERIDDKITFEDDLHFEYMLQAISRQMKYFNSVKLDEKIQFGNRTITRRHLKDSLIEFRKLVVESLNCFQVESSKTCYKKLNTRLDQLFEVYRPIPLKWERGFSENKTLFTAYYSPDLYGSRVQTPIYKNPIYMMPKDDDLRTLTSDEINFQNKLAGKGLVVAYVKESLYDIWLLHVEGGGRVHFKDKQGSDSFIYLSYAGTNRQKFNMLYKTMVKLGLNPKVAGSLKHQREFFNSNPELQREILASCPSYVFFKETKSEPLGVYNIPLTQQRSMATDYRRLKEYGLISYVKTKKPIFTNNRVEKIDFSRFFINQDTGGAIKGNARADLYFGYGKKAELSANYIHGLGEQYFLILK